jgi:hypothetical protein
MLIEPIEIELDKPRKFFLSMKALMRAEQDINRRRGIPAAQHTSIDFLVWKSAAGQVAGTDSIGLDLMVTLLWAGLSNMDPDPAITFDSVLGMMDASPLTRGAIVTKIWNHYNEVTLKQKKESPPIDEVEDSESLARRPGANSGVSQ